jgi:hypothetical protein
MTFTPRQIKLGLAVVVLALAWGLESFFGPLSSFDISIHGFVGWVVSIVLVMGGYMLGSALRQYVGAPRWLENTFEVGFLFPSTWVASLLVPTHVVVTGSVLASTILMVIVLAVLDYLFRGVDQLTRWF